MKAVVAVLCLAVVAPVAAQPAARPSVTPAFTLTESGPAFVVDCPNTSAAIVQWSTIDVGLALRVDSEIHELQGALAGSIITSPGERPEVTPGAAYRILLVLVQTANAPTGPGAELRALRARTRRGWTVPLTAGDHRLAVRCLGVWSADVPFLWDPGNPTGR